MKNTLLLPKVYLHTLNIFDVGNNPPHINHGLMQSEFSTLLKHNVSSILDADFLTLSGHALELLDEEHPELLLQIQEKVQNNPEMLIAALQYNTSLSLLSSKNFLNQWHATNDLFEKYFSRRCKKLYVGAQGIPKQLSSTIQELSLEIIGDATLHMKNAYLGEKNHKKTDKSVGAHSSFVLPKPADELSHHITTELLALEPFLATDEILYQTWQHLASQDIVLALDGSNPQATYDTYYTMMNILNDVAHTIRNVELTKRGEFETSAQIVDEPSKRVLDVINTEVNYYA